MIWLLAGVVYSSAYVAVGFVLAQRPVAQLWVANFGLLVSPLIPIVVVLRRRRDWTGRHRAFWEAIAVGCGLWLAGQLAWAVDELLLDRALPFATWDIVAQLSGSMMPLLALAAWPHAGERRESAATATLDVYALVCIAAFVFWSLVAAPGLSVRTASSGTRLLAVIGPAIRLATVAGLAFAAWAAGPGAWRASYGRLALGSGLAFMLLFDLSAAMLQGSYRSGPPVDVGWIFPFWCFAWAAAEAEKSSTEPLRWTAEAVRPSAPIVLFAALASVPVIGYGLRYLFPLGDPVDHYRGVATAVALTGALGLLMARVIVERRALDAADRHLRLLASALEQNQDLVAIVRGRTIQYVNAALSTALGQGTRQLEGAEWTTLVATESAGEVVHIVETVERGDVARGSLSLVRQDDGPVPVAYVVAPLLDPVQGTMHRVCIFRDLTDDIRLREQMVQSERLSAIGDLVIGVAHELNNPLQSVIGHLELVMTGPIDAAVREDLDRVRFEATRAGRILRNLLAFVRKSPQTRLLADLNEIVRATVASSAYEVNTEMIELREEYDARLPLVLVNRDELQQLVGNLIVNAQQSIRSTGRRGTVTMRTSLSGANAVLDVSDDGAGVPAEVGGRIFEPFFTTKEIGTSSGLGLSIAFGIATTHGGTLELVPVASGACFRLTLPGAGFPGPAYIH